MIGSAHLLTVPSFPLLTWVVVICWDGTALRCVFAPVLGETGAQRKKISSRSGRLVPSPLGALSEVSKQDKRKWRGYTSAQNSLLSPYLTSFPAQPTNNSESSPPKMPVDGEYFLLKVPSLGKEDRQSLAPTQ